MIHKVKNLYIIHSFGTMKNPDGNNWVFFQKKEAQKFYNNLKGSKDFQIITMKEQLYVFETEEQIKEYQDRIRKIKLVMSKNNKNNWNLKMSKNALKSNTMVK